MPQDSRESYERKMDSPYLDDIIGSYDKAVNTKGTRIQDIIDELYEFTLREFIEEAK